MQIKSPISDALVTIIIPAYNEENSIADCLRSILHQSFTPIELIVIDDGSIDQTVSICEDFGVNILRQSHKGIAAARNLGAKNAKGDILVLLDADMVFAPDYVEKLVTPIINGETVATSHWNERVSNWDNPWARCQTWFQNLPDGRRHKLTVPKNSGQYRAVRKDFFLQSGGLSEAEGYGADTSIARRTGVFAIIIEDAICYHKNVETPRELFGEARWHGRNVAADKENRLRRAALTVLIYRNPLWEALRGITLSIMKKEPRLVFYSIIYIAGFDFGVIDALYKKFYQK